MLPKGKGSIKFRLTKCNRMTQVNTGLLNIYSLYQHGIHRNGRTKKILNNPQQVYVRTKYRSTCRPVYMFKQVFTLSKNRFWNPPLPNKSQHVCSKQPIRLQTLTTKVHINQLQTQPPTFSTMALQDTPTVILNPSQRMDIGKDRSVIVKANDKGLTFYGPNGYKIQLSPSAVHVINSFLPQINETVGLLKTGKLTQKYSLPLGTRIFLEIDPNYACVSIRRFFRPKPNPNILLPGFSGIGLKIDEFIQLELNWNQLLQTIPWEEAECCYFIDPNQHTDCQLCWY